MRVLILRPSEVLEETIKKLRDAGFDAYGCPFVKLTYTNFDIPEHDFAIVTSQNAAKVLVSRKANLRKVIAIGKKTAEVLKDYDVMVPSKFDSETLFREYSEILRDKRVIALRSNAGSEILNKLDEICDFSDIVVYRIEKLHGEKQRREIERVRDGFYDAIVFSSSMIARSFLELCDGECIEKLKELIVIAIGPPTARVLEEYGLKPLLPEEYTFDGVISLLKRMTK
ncbi:uroporphyrinogen-III synthase [Archaeoglobus neptunius]|uniref:uroporphyrinogen-III synthase n=1 Tax=Archaeoglobus neptunius TaxID=2798580 RepID=UPI0019276C70|nr:uroporphyrinogen-III synthase [Archaeoglobus neptunius]